MTKNEKMEIYKAINDVSNKLNGVSVKLDKLITRLNQEAHEKIDVNMGGIDDIATIVSTHDEAIDELATLISGMEEN